MLHYLHRLLLIFILAFLSAGAGLLYVFYRYGADLPNYQHLAHYKPPVVTRLYANDGRMFAEYAWEKRIYVPIQDIPKKVIQAFLAAEDKNFYEHGGIDVPSIFSAFFANIGRAAASKRPLGASTITQQVAKNFLLTDIAHAVSYERKIKEALLAFRLENTYSKDHILELFLNEIYLGASSYGVAAAALNYFNKSLTELTTAEIAYLAGLPKAPSRYHPARFPEAAKIRRTYVLRRMAEEGYISQEEAVKASQEPILLQTRDPGEVIQARYFAEEVRRTLMEKFGEKALYQEGLVVRTSLDSTLQKHARHALRQGLMAYDRRHGWRGPLAHLNLSEKECLLPPKDTLAQALWVSKLKGLPDSPEEVSWKMGVILKITSTEALIGFKEGSWGRIPFAEMQWARKYIHEKAVGKAVTRPADVLAVGDVVLVEPLTDPLTFTLRQIPAVSGAIVVLEPHTGRVLAMHGGFMGDFNRATQAWRQTGSAFKPFAYLPALEQGLTPSTRLYDGPFSIDLGYGLGVWTPHNYEENYLGFITLRRALELSRNLVTVRMTHENIGMKHVKEMAERLGVVKNLPLQLSAVLGAEASTLLKITTAYAMIANGGKKITPVFLDRVQDRQGKNLYVHEGLSCERCDRAYWMGQAPLLVDKRPRVLDPTIAYQMISLLQGAVERGTAKALKELNRPLAGKTGTSNEYRDAWLVGFTPDLVVGVFAGFDTPRSLGEHETGARVALPIFKMFMENALKTKPPIPFPVPPGIKMVRVDVMTGLPASGNSGQVIFEAFRSGQEAPSSLPEGEAPSYEAPPPSQENLPSEEILKGDAPPRPLRPAPSSSRTIEGTGGLY